jgi:predicted ATPase/class 3 adenylate cyclase
VRVDLPTGIVTFLVTDVEGSTRLLYELGPERYADALARHRRLVRSAAAARGGVEVDTQGDAFLLAFPIASDALAAAAAMTDALAPGPVPVRIGLHTGTPLVTDEGYVGEDVHVAARVAAAGHGGQILVSAATAALVTEPLHELGEHRLKDIAAPVALFQLGDGSFPPLQTLASSNLPRPASSFVGREQELQAVLARVAGGARLLTLTGPGGAGKTRLALEAAGVLAPDFRAGVVWVDLASLRDPALVDETIARAVGARNGLAAHIGERELLLVVDNLEQVVAAAPELSALVAACPNLAVVVTSRELLRVDGEVEFRVPPLAGDEAVALFCERARLDPSEEIAELCRRLDSLPLGVELAAARATALSPAQIHERLGAGLDLLRGGRDADPRQATLRATIAWSHDLLSDCERRLFRGLSVFRGGCTLEAAEQVAEADLDTLQSLVQKSLLRFSNERYSMLETIREFAAEQLDPQEGEELRARHRSFVVALADASAPSLHAADEAAVSARLDADYANVRAAVADAFARREPDDVARILGALYPFLTSHGHLGEVLGWVEAALAERERLSDRGLAEALVAGGELARFVGRLEWAIELKEELAALPDDVALRVRRPNLKAATLADLCEIALDQADLARARAYAEATAAAGGGARAELCFAELALQSGDLAESQSKGLAALAGLEEGSYNHACTLELLGEAARRAGDTTCAEERFAEGLMEFAAIGDGGGVADCLDGLARLAVDVDTERAGRLHGAAEGIREAQGRRPIRIDVPFPDVPDTGRDLTLDEAVAYALSATAEAGDR